MNQQLICLSAADIHGNKIQYEKIKSLVSKHTVSHVFLCGDLLPKTGGTWTLENKVRTIQMQADFISTYFLQYLTDLGKIATVYAIFGNDDFQSNYHLLNEAAIPNVTFLNNEVTKLQNTDQDLYVAGYPYVGMTPFLHKDWEKWDIEPNDIPHKLYRTDGYSSANGKHYAVNYTNSTSTIHTDLDNLAALSDPQKTIYMFHEAPYDTPLDMIAPDNKYIKEDQLHIGSVAMRDFIDDKQPLVTMHGHIHETYAQSGDFKWKSGRSISLTPANDFSSDILSYVLFSLPDMSQIKRLSA